MVIVHRLPTHCRQLLCRHGNWSYVPGNREGDLYSVRLYKRALDLAHGVVSRWANSLGG